MIESPDDIVGHKTIDTGDKDEYGLPIYRHEPLTRAEGAALWAAVTAAKERRIAAMPDEQSAINAMQDAHTRLRELGWADASYCPKDGTMFHVIEAGSTGIHDASYQGEWPKGSWWIHHDGDMSPSRPVLFKRYPADQAIYDQKMKEAGERVRKMIADERAACETCGDNPMFCASTPDECPVPQSEFNSERAMK